MLHVIISNNDKAAKTDGKIRHRGRLWFALTLGITLLLVIVCLNFLLVSGGRLRVVTIGFPFIFAQQPLSVWNVAPFTPNPLAILCNWLYAFLLIFLLWLWCQRTPEEPSVFTRNQLPPNVLQLVLATQLLVVFGIYFSRSYEFVFLPLPFLALWLAKFIFVTLLFVLRYRSAWFPVLLLILFLIFLATFRPAFEVINLSVWQEQYDSFKMSLIFTGQFLIYLFVFRFWGLTFQHQLNQGPRRFRLSEAFFLTSIIAVLLGVVPLIEYLYADSSNKLNQAKIGNIMHTLILSTSILLIVHEWVIRGRVWLALLLAECLAIFGFAIAYKLDPQTSIWRPHWHVSLFYPLSVIGALSLLEWCNLRLVITRWGKYAPLTHAETKTATPLELADPWDH